MPNRNYEKGRRKEYKTVKMLKSQGFDIAQRMAGSHSPIDVFGIDTTNKVIRLIQCKPDNYSDAKTSALYKANSNLNGPFEVHFDVI